MEADTLELLFVGTGVSCAIPVIGHLGSSTGCCCEEAVRDTHSRNRRNNVSLLFSLFHGNSVPPTPSSAWEGNRAVEKKEESNASVVSPQRNAVPGWRILIDCGKTFRNAYFRVLATRGIRYVDALLLTHGHADAINGIEELCDVHNAALEEWKRDFGHHTKRKESGKMEILPAGNRKRSLSIPLKPCVGRIPMYLSIATLKEVRSGLSERFIYQGRAENADEVVTPFCSCSSPLGIPSAICSNAQLCPYLLRDDCVSSMTSPQSYIRDSGKYGDGTKGLPIDFPLYAVPVEHGKNYMSFGFVFGRGTRFKEGDLPFPVASHYAPLEVEDEKKGHALWDGNTAPGPCGCTSSCVVYLSDISEIPPFAYAFLKSLVQIDILVIDLLAEHGSSSPAHTCWDDLWPIFHSLHPKKVYCVGMFCSIDHHQANELWKEELEREREVIRKGICSGDWESDPEERAWKEHFLNTVKSIELAYDGLALRIPA